MISWNPINSRLLSARFLHRHGKMTVIVAYAPTNVAEEAAKIAFYDQLHQTIQRIPRHDITIVLTDANATISATQLNNTPDTAVTGTTFIDPLTNDNGERLLLLCQSHKLCVADTWFPRKRIHYWTW